jgi:hypothetical protein
VLIGLLSSMWLLSPPIQKSKNHISRPQTLKQRSRKGKERNQVHHMDTRGTNLFYERMTIIMCDRTNHVHDLSLRSFTPIANGDHIEAVASTAILLFKANFSCCSLAQIMCTHLSVQRNDLHKRVMFVVNNRSSL